MSNVHFSGRELPKADFWNIPLTNDFKCFREIDGTPYEAYVKEKEEAKRVYNQAQSQGQSAGLVELK